MGNMVVWNLWSTTEKSGYGAESPSEHIPSRCFFLHSLMWTISLGFSITSHGLLDKASSLGGEDKEIGPKSLWEGTYQTFPCEQEAQHKVSG